MKSPRRLSGFSLVEVTLALGVAAFCLLAVLALLPVSAKTNQAAIQQTTAHAIISDIATDLNAAARLPPGQLSKQFSLNNHWESVAIPDDLYFTNDAKPIGTKNQTTVPPEAVFRATITYRLPPTDTTSLANIRVSWPAAQSDQTKVAGSVEMFVAINRL